MWKILNSILRSLYVYSRYQQQLQHVMTMSMGARLDELQSQDEKSLDTAMALSEIRTQLQELTKSVESCQTEVIKKYFKKTYRKSNFSTDILIV